MTHQDKYTWEEGESTKFQRPADRDTQTTSKEEDRLIALLLLGKATPLKNPVKGALPPTVDHKVQCKPGKDIYIWI